MIIILILNFFENFTVFKMGSVCFISRTNQDRLDDFDLELLIKMEI